MGEFPTFRVAIIGAAGGLALSLLKLLEARFFVDAPLGAAAIGSYLSCASYMILGSLAATFLADHELTYQKLRKSAFMFGLAAPSVLFALTTQTLRPSEPLSIPLPSGPIPSASSWLPIGYAFAQSIDSTVARPTQDRVLVLPETALKPSLADGFAAAWGRGTIQPRFAYVLGKGTDKSVAISTAANLNALLSSQPEVQSPDLVANVVRVKGGSEYFIVVGGIGAKQDVAQTWIRAQKAVNAYSATGLQETPNGLSMEEVRALIQRVREAPVIPAMDLVAR